MPRGFPKPPGACERTGCYELAVATVRVWHGAQFGYRSSTINTCRRHAEEYEPDREPSRHNGADVSWHPTREPAT